MMQRPLLSQPVRSKPRWYVFSICFTLLLALATALPQAARAQVGSARYSAIIIDAASGNVLSADSPDAPRYPASLTKLMTLYLTFEALRDRRVLLTDPVPVSAYAASMAPSKLGLEPGSTLTVEEAIYALVTKSANDAATALGEMLGGDETQFARMMTLRARSLGMSNTVFRNASGLPDAQQMTTARDLSTLARRLIVDFPGFYGYFSTPEFTWQGHTILTHDHMLETYPGADGMKTGYTAISGCNLVTSAVRGGVRLIGVVMGAKTGNERDEQMSALLDQGFGQLGVASVQRAPLPQDGADADTVAANGGGTDSDGDDAAPPQRSAEAAAAPEAAAQRLSARHRLPHGSRLIEAAGISRLHFLPVTGHLHRAIRFLRREAMN